MTAPIKNILTIANPGYDVVVFHNSDGSAEAVITQPGKSKMPTIVKIAPPDAGRQIVVQRHPNGAVVVEYRNAP